MHHPMQSYNIHVNKGRKHPTHVREFANAVMIDSKHPEKLLSLVIRYEQPASLSELARTPANICGQAGQMHIYTNQSYIK
jgi:hypothetical protein